jgi:hypothetical protein
MTAKTEIVDFLGDMRLVLPALLDAAIIGNEQAPDGGESRGMSARSNRHFPANGSSVMRSDAGRAFQSFPIGRTAPPCACWSACQHHRPARR